MFLSIKKDKVINIGQVRTFWVTYRDRPNGTKMGVIIFEYPNTIRDELQFETEKDAITKYEEIKEAMGKKVIYINNSI